MTRPLAALTLAVLMVAASGPTLAGDELRGDASWVRASLGSRYLAMRIPKGTRVTICHADDDERCVNRVVRDYGPSKRIHPDRVADLSAADFGVVCGPLSKGTCSVVVTVLREPNLTLPPTDMVRVPQRPEGRHV